MPLGDLLTGLSLVAAIGAVVMLVASLTAQRGWTTNAMAFGSILLSAVSAVCAAVASAS
jgi:hypothetical protein